MDNVIDFEDRKRNLDLDYEGIDDLQYDQKQWSPINEQGEESGYGVWNEEVRAWMDLNTLKGLFFNDEWVFILVDRFASKIAAQEIRVMTEKVINGKKSSDPQEDHAVQKLLYAPNENQTYYQWIYSCVVDYLVAGNAIIYRSPVSGELIHIPVEMIQLDFDTNGKLRSYRIIQYSTNYEMPIAREIMRIDPKHVAHVRRPNPSSALWGLSGLIPGRKSILFNRYSLEYLNNFYLKGAQPGLILKLDDEANEKSALRLLRSMEMAHTGRKNQRRNMVLPKGVTASNITQSLADQQLKDYIDQNRETIINIFQIPKQELSLDDGGKALGSNEYKMAIRNFWSGPLKSIMKAFEESLTKLLRPELGDEKFYLEFDLTDVEFLQDDLNAKADLAIKMLATHTLNEVRAQIFDDAPLEGGDVTPQAAKVPAPTTPTAPSPSAASLDTEQVKAEPEVETPGIDNHQEIDARQMALDKNVAAFEQHKGANPTWWMKREDTLRKDEAKRFGAVHKITLDLFGNQLVSAVKIMRKNLSSTSGYYPKAKIKRELKAAFDKHQDHYMDQMSKPLTDAMDLGYDAQLMLPDIAPKKSMKAVAPNRTTIEALRARNAAKRRDMLDGRVQNTFAGMNDVTSVKIMNIIQEGVENSRTIDEIQQNLVNDISELSNSRAQTIARTEVLTAASIGQAAAMQDAASVIPNLKKMWINAGDNRVRGNPHGLYNKSTADHWTLGGELVDHDENFSNGLAYPRDPDSKDGGEVINCRCTFIMVPGDDAEAMGIQRAQDQYDAIQGTDNAG